MIDIAIYENLEKYLLERKIINKQEGYSISYCRGGVSGTVSFVYAGEKPLIIKQALAQLKVKETWLCDQNRMNIEQESNRIYHRLVPQNAPEVYFYDAENYIYGREAVPESCSMWKEDLMTGLLDFEVARKSIESLMIVHNECSGDPMIAKKFDNNQIFYDLRISPYIEFVLGKYPQLKPFAVPIIKQLMEEKITLVHGDYSPKNIMIDGRDICILDYEVAHYGHPSFDLAFFSNHFILKSIKNKKWAAAYLNMLAYMMHIYFDGVTLMDKTELETAAVKLLSLLMLARVDGKSPVEYITEEIDKQLVRDCAFIIIDTNITDYSSAIDMIKHKILTDYQEEATC